MSQTGLEGFDVTVQKSQLWLKDLMEELGVEDRHKAYLALRAVLHALRDRLPVTEVAQLGAQLPMLLRGVYYEGWKPAGKPLKERHKEEFLALIREHLANDRNLDPETIACATFRVLARRLTEAESIKRLLPAELRMLWPPSITDMAYHLA
jgi:uncharacterized protein (DUF2267 family)